MDCVQKLTARRIVCPKINFSIPKWAYLCMSYQRAKTHHLKYPPVLRGLLLSIFWKGCEDIVGRLLSFGEYRYLLKFVDCFLGWCKAMPLTAIEARIVWNILGTLGVMFWHYVYNY